MSHYKPYPAYKNSGVEWIGPVPAHWETLRIKRAATLRNERRNDSPDGWTYVGLEDVEPESGRYAPTGGHSRQSEDSMVGVFRAGDVLYGKLRPYLRKAIVAERDGVCSTEFLVLDTGRASAPWLHRWLLTPDVTQQIEAGCDGAKMPRADWEHVGSIPMPLPSPAEQSAITAALDRETARIDALIARKTRFIELLKEKRQALITHAVTKGLDSNVKMKDSGVEWIGEVPEHWDVVAIKRLTPVQRGASPRPIDDPKYFDDAGMFGWTRIEDVSSSDGVLRETKQRLSPLGASLSVKLAPGDLFLSIAATVGKPCISAIDVCIHDGFVYFPRLKLNPWWLFRIFECGAAFVGLGKLGTQLNLNTETVAAIKIPLPPATELRPLLDFIRRAMSRIDKLLAKVEHSIAMLKERRGALITAAVTGKIDLARGDRT